MPYASRTPKNVETLAEWAEVALQSILRRKGLSGFTVAVRGELDSLRLCVRCRPQDVHQIPDRCMRFAVEVIPQSEMAVAF